MRSRLMAAASTAVLILAAAGCGADDDPADVAAPEGDGEFTLEIVSPSNNAEVGLPFMVELSVDTELGPPESGLHHAHVFFDGDMDNFEIIDAETWEITADSPIVAGVEAGARVLNVTLHTANHEPVGAEDGITIQLTDAGTPGSDDDSDPGY